MAHLHLPDGVIPLWVCALFFGIVIVTLGVSIFILRKYKTDPKKRILAALLTAVVLIAMQIPIPIAGGFAHLSLVPLLGLLLNPPLAFLSVIVLNLFCAMVGHGGITTLGINIFAMGVIEVWTAFILFHCLGKAARGQFVFSRAVIATATALIISTLFIGWLVSVVGVAMETPNGGGETNAPLHSLNVEDLIFRLFHVTENESVHTWTFQEFLTVMFPFQLILIIPEAIITGYAVKALAADKK
jgi:cobalt/nickel transport system permease protein